MQVSILFEVEDLSQASPATVSRAGMIYLNVEDLGWKPFVQSWMAKKSQPVLVETLWKLINKYMEAVLEFKRLHCRVRLRCISQYQTTKILYYIL